MGAMETDHHRGEDACVGAQEKHAAKGHAHGVLQGRLGKVILRTRMSKNVLDQLKNIVFFFNLVIAHSQPVFLHDHLLELVRELGASPPFWIKAVCVFFLEPRWEFYRVIFSSFYLRRDLPGFTARAKATQNPQH